MEGMGLQGFYAREDVMTISLHMDHGSWGPSHKQSLHVSTRLAEGQLGWDGMGWAGLLGSGDWANI